MNHILYSLALSILTAAFWAWVFSSTLEILLLSMLINFVGYWFGYGLLRGIAEKS